MKKYIILAIVIIAVVIFVIQKKNTPPAPTQIQNQPEEIKIGREIPKDNAQTPPPIQTLSPAYMQLTGCNKTFEDIILEYNKEWGPLAQKKLTFTPEETNNIINLINEYITCQAIALKEPSKCNLFEPVKEGCINQYYNFQFAEFFIGANKDTSDCKKYLEIISKNPKNDGMGLISLGVNHDRLCSEIKNDIRGICDRLFNDSSKKEKCYKVFPKNILDGCPMKNKEECVKAYENAKTTGEYDCDLLNENKKENCEIRKMGINACNDKLNKLLLTYCSYKDNIKKRLEEFELKKKAEEEKIKTEKEKLQKSKEEEERKKLEGEIIKKAKQAAEEAKKFKGRKNVDEE